MKICKKCKIKKSYSCFNPSQWGDGFRATCKQCRSIHESKQYYQKNKERIKQHRIGNKKYLEYNRNYYKSNIEYFEKYRLENHEHYASWRKVNRQKLNKYRMDKLKNDIEFRLSAILRTRLSTLLRRNKCIKYDSTLKLLGCSLEEFKVYMSAKFTIGMSWDNYGDWHIDHIKPCSKFDLSIEKEQRICFHYTNLQPLWAIDNLKKGNRY